MPACLPARREGRKRARRIQYVGEVASRVPILAAALGWRVRVYKWLYGNSTSAGRPVDGGFPRIRKRAGVGYPGTLVG